MKMTTIRASMLVLLGLSGSALAQNVSAESQKLLNELKQKISLTTNKIKQLEQAAGNTDFSLSWSQPEAVATPMGLVVDETTATLSAVQDGSLAERIGLKVGDRLQAVNGVSIERHGMTGLYELLADLEADEDITFSVKRNGKLMNLKGQVEELVVPGYTLSVNPNQMPAQTEMSLSGEQEQLDSLLTARRGLNRGYKYKFVPSQWLEPCQSEECVETYNQYKKYADKGFVVAKLRIGEFHFYGYGIESNKGLALEYFKPLAKRNGSAYAQYMTGIIYQDLQDFDLARKYLKRAARGKSVRGMYELGLSYLIGDWLEQDLHRADKWLARAYKYAPNKLTDLSVKIKANYPDVYARLSGFIEALETKPNEHLRDSNGNSYLVKSLLSLYPNEDIFTLEKEELSRAKRQKPSMHYFPYPNYPDPIYGNMNRAAKFPSTPKTDSKP